jgi:hypothetical protein
LHRQSERFLRAVVWGKSWRRIWGGKWSTVWLRIVFATCRRDWYFLNLLFNFLSREKRL